MLCLGHLDSAQLGLAWFDLAQLGSSHLGFPWFSSAQFTSALHSLAKLCQAIIGWISLWQAMFLRLSYCQIVDKIRPKFIFERRIPVSFRNVSNVESAEES